MHLSNDKMILKGQKHVNEGLTGTLTAVGEDRNDRHNEKRMFLYEKFRIRIFGIGKN